MLLMPPLCFSSKLLADLHNARIPVVRIAAEVGSDPSPCIDVDDRAAARQMTEHLLGLGHRHIGFIKGHPDHAASALRFDGYCSALQAAGVALRPASIVQGLFTVESGFAASKQLLLRKNRPTAIFASNDDMAAGCLAAAHEAGISVPSQLSIAGFDDTYLARMVWPPLTTVRQPIYDIGFAAAHQLLTLIQGGNAARKITLSYRLIERETTAPPTEKQRS
jgi:LacI family transcriptional regulator